MSNMSFRKSCIRRACISSLVVLSLWLVSLPHDESMHNSGPSAASTRPPPTPPDALADHRCPPQHPADHGLVSTGRRALVFYTFTSHDNMQNRQVELDNYLFFQAHGVFTPETPTALFSGVDYIIIRSDLGRAAPSHNASDESDDSYGVRECGTGPSIGPRSNVRYVETPAGPCDLCSIGRTIKALGGAEAIAHAYEFVVSVNSGTRGPFFSESPPDRDGASPVTWIDHLALGGETVYTGAVMTFTSGVSVDTGRPFLFSFAFGVPSSALTVLEPVLIAGCVQTGLPGLWFAFFRAFDIDYHRYVGREEALRIVRAAMNRTAALPIRFGADDTPAVRAVKHEIEATVADGFNRSKSILKRVFDLLHEKERGDVWGNDIKMRCVFRSEGQLMKSIMDAQLPPEKAPVGFPDGNGQPSPVFPKGKVIWRPLLTSAQVASLSPVLSGYLHEGHFFARSLYHNETLVNMVHAHAVLSRPQPGDIYMAEPCSVMFLKFGGGAWRDRAIPPSVIRRVQELALGQRPLRRSASGAAPLPGFAHALRCLSPVTVNKL